VHGAESGGERITLARELHSADCSRVEDDVGVERYEMGCPRRRIGNADVASNAETAGSAAGGDPSEPVTQPRARHAQLLNELPRAVARTVVDDNDVEEATRLNLETTKRQLEVRAAVRARDRDGKRRAGVAGFRGGIDTRL
jgi:hypothetical protein